VKEQVEAILAEAAAEGFEVGYELHHGIMWEMWVGSQGGGRERDGVGLARKLVDNALRQKQEQMARKPKAKPVPVPPQPLTAPLAAKPTPPQTDYDAIIAGLKAQLAEALAKAPEPVEIPEFIKLPEEIPSELADLIEYADTPAQSNEKLLARLREVLGLIGLAEDAGGRAAPELYRRRDRLESGIRFNRGRMAESL
jgi:hypothetical protein